MFVELTIQPAAGDGVATGTRVVVGNAAVAFVRNGGENATLLARDRFSREWIDTQAAIPLGADGQPVDAHRLTFRIDRALGVFDVFLDALLLDYDLPLTPPASNSIEVRIVGGDVADTWLADFLASEHNPLAEDLLGSGIPDEWLRGRGIDPGEPHRYVDLAGDGSWVIEEYFAELRPDYRPTETARTRETAGRSSGRIPRLVVFTPLEQLSFHTSVAPVP